MDFQHIPGANVTTDSNTMLSCLCSVCPLESIEM